MDSMLFELAVKATLLLGVCGLVAAAARRAPASLRHLIWLAGVAALLALPVALLVAPGWAPALPRAAQATQAAARTVIVVTADAVPSGVPWRWWMAGLWAGGAALLLLRLGLGHRRASKLARNAGAWRRVDGVEVLVSAGIDVPVVCGAARPVVLLPAEATAWPADRLEMVLRHEVSHAVRRDTLAQLAAELACALYWPLPWVWMAASRLRKEAELACDDGVLRHGGRASDYAGHLIEIVRGLNGRERIPQGAIPMARINDLEHRLRALLRNNLRRGPVGRGAVLTVAAAALALLAPLAALRMPALAADGGIRGVVRDPSGAVVPKARVSLSFNGSSRREAVYSNEAGEFALAPLPDGNYNVAVAKPGFALLELKGIVVEGGASQPLQIMLMTGRVHETVNVVGEGGPKPAVAPLAPGQAPTRIRVGGSVQAVKLVTKVTPKYPPSCKAEGIQGSVLMRAVIGKDGSVLNLEVLNQIVDPRLVEAAVEAVKQWRYQPTLLNGEPVEILTEIDVNFTLLQ
ncbi:MAG: TonB family protein [Candidatus Solibacter usitatus]|nr:TonB family protein [Candidatus Solibacter usitatus]